MTNANYLCLFEYALTEYKRKDFKKTKNLEKTNYFEFYLFEC